MSGLLRRLAGQALNGGGPAIHSQARMPYLAPLEFASSQASQPMAAVQPATDPAPAPVAVQPLHSAPPSNAGPAAAMLPSAAASRPNAVPAPIGQMQENAPAEAVGPPAHFAPASPRPAGPMPADADRFPPLIPGNPGRQGEAASMPAGQPQMTVSQPNPLPLTDAQSASPRLPAPLLAASRPPLPAESARPASPPPGSPQTARASLPEANEVHVHIGRIEVTAVHESQPPKRAAALPRRQPLSLDDYLAKRRGGPA